MKILSPPHEKIDQNLIFGLGIKCIGAVSLNQRHCGLIYRINTNEVRFLHLAFHFQLIDEVFDETYSWTPSGLEKFDQVNLAAIAKLIAEGKPSIPYSFDADGIVFDPNTGHLKEVSLGKGLTCATFTLAVFKTYGYDVIELKGWQTRDDDAQWHERMLKLMEEKHASNDHLQAIKESGPHVRVRPEEVVGCASQESDEWSIGFDKALLLANQVVQDLQSNC